MTQSKTPQLLLLHEIRYGLGKIFLGKKEIMYYRDRKSQ